MRGPVFKILRAKYDQQPLYSTNVGGIGAKLAKETRTPPRNYTRPRRDLQLLQSRSLPTQKQFCPQRVPLLLAATEEIFQVTLAHDILGEGDLDHERAHRTVSPEFEHKLCQNYDWN